MISLTSRTTTPVVYVVDDDASVRKSLSALIRAMQLDVATYASARDFLRAYDGSRPGCVVLDLRLPGIDGLDLMDRLAGMECEPQFIITTGDGDVPSAVRAVKLGAIDYIEKPYEPNRLHQSINRALELDARRRNEAERQADVQSRLVRLSDVERQVLEMMVAGSSNSEIAGSLNVSLRTVHTRRAHILRIFDVDNRAELLRSVVVFLAERRRPLVGELAGVLLTGNGVFRIYCEFRDDTLSGGAVRLAASRKSVRWEPFV